MNKAMKLAEIRGGATPLSLPPPPAISLDPSSIEKLLLHCSAALESHDTTLAQQVMWVLHNVASPDGSPTQRLASFFLKALLLRAHFPLTSITPPLRAHGTMSVTDLARQVDLTPWHRFGFSASNSAILRSVANRPKIHILDFSVTHLMQWPTLLDSLANRPEGPPSLLRLAAFARSRHIPFQSNMNEPTFDDDEALVVNCQSWLRHLSSRSKDAFLESVRALGPVIFTVSDEDADLDSPSLTARIAACFEYFWIPFDAMETLLPRGSGRRAAYEAGVGERIENVVGFEEGMERVENGRRTGRRARRAGFTSLPFGEETVREVREMLEEHASGWGMKREEDMLVMTWKGHSSVYTSAWVPA